MAKSKKIRLIFFIYWFLLLYIIAALVWWYIALSQQNEQMAKFKLQDLKKDDIHYSENYEQLIKERSRKAAQYAGEGAIFFLLIVAGAIFVYRTVNRELKLNRRQHNFMMAITHELKTPIAVAKLNLETLQLRKLDEAQQQRLLYNTLQETNRLNSLCNNMLLSSQIEAGGYRITNEEIDISNLVQNSVDDFRRRFPQRQFEIDAGTPLFVSGDMLLIQMAVNNLLDNALKYSSKEDKVFLKIYNGNKTVSIEVQDQGLGIGLAERKHVFEKFYRLGNEASKNTKGTGLGLFVTKKIVDAHHGRIYIKDNKPKGTIFVLEFKQV